MTPPTGWNNQENGPCTLPGNTVNLALMVKAQDVRAGELTYPLADYSTLESRSSMLTGQHSGSDFGGEGCGELASGP